MGSPSRSDFDKLNLLLAHDNRLRDLDVEPTPYTFAKVENGKKTIIDSPTLSLPRWLLLDHTIAVIWLMFSSNFPLHQLNINDLKWAHQFLKEIRNSKGENPPDVKTCLKEIQDLLIHLYARLTNPKDEFGKNLESDETRLNCRQLEKMSLLNSQSPSRTTIKLDYPLLNEYSSQDLTLAMPNQKKTAVNHSKKIHTLLPQNSNINGDVENLENAEVEKFFLGVFKEKKEAGPNQKSLIPTSRRTTPVTSISEEMATGIQEEQTSTRVQCFAEMTSVKYQKSMTVQDKAGDKAAFANLKAEIQEMKFNPDISREDLIEQLKNWRTEQVEKLRSSLQRLNSIEEIIKGVKEVQLNTENPCPDENAIELTGSNDSIIKKLLQ